MKSVLLSINPKWCELIVSGEKTIEVRKTRPKIATPFKCYIYCTQEKYQGKYLHTSNKRGRLLGWENPNDCEITVQPEDFIYTAYTCRGKVIGEFVCDFIVAVSIKYSDTDSRCAKIEFPYTCMTDKEIIDYLGNGNKGYGWHISELQIYDEPKELCSFVKPCDREYDCCVCMRWDKSVQNCEDSIINPPQSWCYVEAK